MTQTEEVYEYMKNHGSITPLEALRELGIMRLASRISDLKRNGIPLNRKMIAVIAKNGRKCYVAEYSIKETELSCENCRFCRSNCKDRELACEDETGICCEFQFYDDKEAENE